MVYFEFFMYVTKKGKKQQKNTYYTEKIANFICYACTFFQKQIQHSLNVFHGLWVQLFSL